MAKPLKTFLFKVRGREWKVFVYTVEEYRKIEDVGDSHALTDTDLREFYFQTKWLDLPTIRHEVVHAFVKECHVESANLQGAQMEELLADFFAYSLEEFVTASEKLWCRLSGLKIEDIPPDKPVPPRPIEAAEAVRGKKSNRTPRPKANRPVRRS